MENIDIPQEVYEGKPWNTSEESFDEVGKAKVESLKGTVEEIDELMSEREELSGEFINEGEKMKRDIKNFLSENSPQGEDDSEFARERAELRKKSIEISELQLNERVGCWRDIALLKRELRDRQKELSERESRSEILGKILTDGGME
jgi:hypothetical protein